MIYYDKTRHGMDRVGNQKPLAKNQAVVVKDLRLKKYPSHRKQRLSVFGI